MAKWWKNPGVGRWLMGSGRPHDMPGWVYMVQLGWAGVLLALFLAFVASGDRLGLPSSLGKVPIEAPWMGAVGGLLASLGGIVRYAKGHWNARFNYWHPIKPLMAAAAGGVSCLLVIVLFNATSGGSASPVDPTTLDVAAFVFGFAEASFRQLIKAVTDIFLKPGTSAPPAGSGSASGGGVTPPEPPSPQPAQPTATGGTAGAPAGADPAS
jgi:hypothetical protein